MSKLKDRRGQKDMVKSNRLRLPGTKIEKIGLAEEVLSLLNAGHSHKEITKRVKGLVSVPIHAIDIKLFLEGYKNSINDNKDLTLKVDNHMKALDLKVLGQWDVLDTTMSEILDDAKEILVRAKEDCMKDTQKTSKEIQEILKVMLLTMKQIIRVNESRVSIRGLVRPTTNITNTTIQLQYNNIKELIFKAEDKFPGIIDWVAEHSGMDD